MRGTLLPDRSRQESILTQVQIDPHDEFNRELVDQAHPTDWRNPTPSGRYNLVAIGGGTAGIIAALGAAGLGGKAALIERHLLGGDCLNYGCVPSKALIRAARAAYEVRSAGRFGVDTAGEPRIDFGQVMQRLRRLRAAISHHDSAARFASLGVDVYLGSAQFTGSDSLEVEGQTLRYSRCVIATGGRPARPDIAGLEEVGFLTNETVFSLTQLPRRLLVVGGGPIGCEMAQAFRRLGCHVELVQHGPRLLRHDDPAAAAVLQKQFLAEGIGLHFNARIQRAERSADGKRLVLESDAGLDQLEGDEILVAVGRVPNVEGLDLEAAGVCYGPRGIEVDDRLRTSNRRMFAAGDIAGSYQFTHAADAMARLCLANSLFFGRQKLSGLIMPHTTYTDPEVAHVGLTPAEAAKQGIEIDSYRQELADVDRAALDDETEGFAVLHCRRGTDHVVGGTIVAAHAGEMIGVITLLLSQRKPSLKKLAGMIHCYPTQVEVLKRIADAYNRTRLTPLVARLLRRWLAWRR